MRESDLAWLVEHSPEIFRQYAGKWIAVRDGAVIGVGDTAPECVEQAERLALDGDFILEGVESETDVIYGHA